MLTTTTLRRLGARALSSTAGRTVLSSASAGADNVVRVSWKDGHESEFLPVWLLDHNPATLHPTSLQRQLDSASLDADTPAPEKVTVEDDGARLAVEWADQRLEFDADWLRAHCYDEASQQARHKALASSRRLWASKDLPKEKVTRVSAEAVKESDAALKLCLEALVETGVAIVTDMPDTMEGTEAVVRRIGPPRETFYGGIWDTAPKNAAEVNDTAYTKDALHGHTDTSYLMDSAGLQLFNCVAQSESETGINHEGEVEGATKLVDGFKVVTDLREQHPDTYDFFLRTPLKWHCIEEGVFVKAWAPVIETDPGFDTLRQFRYNSYDLSPIDYLRPSQVRDYYHHTRVLNSYLRSPEYISYMRMNVGEMVIIDNQRVCHGRTAFSGFRNMVGCYIGRDDWLSTLRALGRHDLPGDA